MLPYKALFLFALLCGTMVSVDGACALDCGYVNGDLACYWNCDKRRKREAISEAIDATNGANSEYTKFGVPILSGAPPPSFHKLFTLPKEDGGYILIKAKNP